MRAHPQEATFLVGLPVEAAGPTTTCVVDALAVLLATGCSACAMGDTSGSNFLAKDIRMLHAPRNCQIIRMN